ncbi:hypothetical protein ACRCUN_14480 [Mycobacterium sp. LTG2003]
MVQQSHPVAGILDLGRYPHGRDDLAEQVTAAFRAAQFLSETRDAIMAWKYRKLIANLGNGVTARTGAVRRPMNSLHSHRLRPSRFSPTPASS